MPPAHEQTTADRANDHKKSPQTPETKTNLGLAQFVTAACDHSRPPLLPGVSWVAA
jgi:hypothetical protein